MDGRNFGLRMVRHNSGELFHLHAAGHFYLAKTLPISAQPQPLISWRLCLALNPICLENLEPANLDPGGRRNSLTFGMGNSFLMPPNNQTNFPKTPNNQLSSFETKVDTKKMVWTKKRHTRNITPQIISPTPDFKPHIVHLRDLRIRVTTIMNKPEKS